MTSLRSPGARGVVARSTVWGLGACLSCGEVEETEPAAGRDPFDVVPSVSVEPMPEEVVFSPRGGGFTGTQLVSISTEDDSPLHVTTDGSLPSEDSPVYSGPLEVSETTILRVWRSDPDVFGPQKVATQTYVLLDDRAAEFTSNLPLIVLERHGDEPIETNSNELRRSSVLVFEPGADGRTRLLGEAALSLRAGVRVRGQSSRGFPQKSYAVEVWHPSVDDDRDVPLLGMPAESDWALVAPGWIDRSLMRTMLPMDLSRRMGVYAPRTRFAEVFLVDREGSERLSVEDYVGVYTVAEKIKRGPARVPVSKISDEAVSGDGVTGGYIVRIDHGEEHLRAGGYGFQWEEPSAEEMQVEARRPQVEYLQGYLEQFFAALERSDFTHPETGQHYSDYVDVAAFIDHNWLVALSKNVDGLRLSAYFYKDRGAKLVAGPIWDFDRSLGTPHDDGDRAESPTEWSSGDGTDPRRVLFWGALFEDPEFEAAYWARWDELSVTHFRAEALVQMVDEYEGQLVEARERHFARWREMEPEGGPAGEVEILRTWLQQRVQWLAAERP